MLVEFLGKVAFERLRAPHEMCSRGLAEPPPRRAQLARRQLSHERDGVASRLQKRADEGAADSRQHRRSQNPRQPEERAAQSSADRGADDRADSRHCHVFLGRDHRSLHDMRPLLNRGVTWS
jgi:hypothetical protein